MHGQLLRIDEATSLLGDKTGDRSAFSAWVEDVADPAGEVQLMDEFGDALEDVFVDALNAEDANDYFAQVQRGIRSAINNSMPSGIPENMLRRFAGLLRRYRSQRFDEMQAAEDLADQFSQEDTDEAAALLGGLLARTLVRPPARPPVRSLPRPVRQQLVRNTRQAAQTLARRQGIAAVRALPPIARSVQRTAIRQRTPVRTLPSAIRNVTNRVAQMPTIAQNLAQSRPLANPPVTTATPRVLTYTTRDVIDKRISVPAQHSLVRLSKNPATSSDAVGMLEEIKAGRLAGIYCVNWQIPAQRALRMGGNWWSVIPQGEDAVLMLDPDNLSTGQPLIAFRRQLDQSCGVLKGEKPVTTSLSKLDQALSKVWWIYLRFRMRTLVPCDLAYTKSYNIMSRTRQLGLEPIQTPCATLPILCNPLNLTIIAWATGFPRINRASIASDDLLAIADQSRANATVGIESLLDLLNYINSCVPNEIKTLFIMGHSGGQDRVLFTRDLGQNDQDRRNYDAQRRHSLSVPNLNSTFVSNYIRENHLWDRFAAYAEIIVVSCRAGERTTTLPDGIVEDTSLFAVISEKLKVCVKGFKRRVCVIRHTRRGQLVERLLMYPPPNSQCNIDLNLHRSHLVRRVDELNPDSFKDCQDT